mgnify:CR=1 FL=1
MDPKSLLYTESHEWISTAGDVLVVGITDHAQHLLGDIVFVELPKAGKKVKKGDEVMIVESPKAAASVYAPVSGEVVEVNADLEASPGTINASPYDGGWLVKIRPSAFAAEKSSLLSHDDYQTKVAEA